MNEACGVKVRLGKKFNFKRRCVFVLPVQAREVLQENSLGYDGTVSGRLVSYNLRFPGQYWDSETGLHQNYFRDYDPSTGRYPQSDPIGLAGGSFSTYSYVRSNPVGFIDPLGLEAVLPGPYGIPVPVLPITPPSNSGSGSAGAFPWNTPQSSQPFWPSWMQFAPTPGGGGESGEDYFQCLTKCDTAKTAGHNYCLWAYGPKGITPSDYNLVSCVAGITDTWQACRASCQKSCK
jgi:RHS repeat-associated protein